MHDACSAFPRAFFYHCGDGMNRIFYGKNETPFGTAPAIILQNPKYPRNLGAVVRAAACWGISQVWFSGTRAIEEIEQGSKRLPREERMRDYQDVKLINFDYPFDAFRRGTDFVAVEVRQSSENLIEFEHNPDSVYVFGPEDGSLDKSFLGLCHRFVIIPSRHCLNLAAATNIVLYDRTIKNWIGGEKLPSFNQKQMFVCEMEG